MADTSFWRREHTHNSCVCNTVPETLGLRGYQRDFCRELKVFPQLTRKSQLHQYAVWHHRDNRISGTILPQLANG